jgi:hypothetical protein
VADSCERGDEHSSSIKRKEFLHYVRRQQLIKKHPAPCSSLAAIALNPNNLLQSLSQRVSPAVTSHTTHNILLNSLNILQNMSISTTELPVVPRGSHCSADSALQNITSFPSVFVTSSPTPTNLIRFAGMALRYCDLGLWGPQVGLILCKVSAKLARLCCKRSAMADR